MCIYGCKYKLILIKIFVIILFETIIVNIQIEYIYIIHIIILYDSNLLWLKNNNNIEWSSLE